jgi:hypothetical protein
MWYINDIPFPLRMWEALNLQLMDLKSKCILCQLQVFLLNMDIEISTLRPEYSVLSNFPVLFRDQHMVKWDDKV